MRLGAITVDLLREMGGDSNSKTHKCNNRHHRNCWIYTAISRTFRAPLCQIKFYLKFILLHKYFMLNWKFTGSQHGHLYPSYYLASDQRRRFYLSLIICSCWIEMGLSLFTSSFEVISLWKVSFMAQACRDGPFALTHSHGHTAAALSTKRRRFFLLLLLLLSKPWIWMSTPAFLICIFFFFQLMFCHQRFINACVFVHAFFTHRFFFSSFVCPLTGAYEWQQYCMILHTVKTLFYGFRSWMSFKGYKI